MRTCACKTTLPTCDNAPRNEADPAFLLTTQTRIVIRFHDRLDGHCQATDQSETGMPTHPPAFLSTRPIIMKLPKPFKGEHNNMDRFIGDCNAYFETFRHQFRGVLSLMVVCTTSLFTKRAKNWWTHRCEDFWVNDYRDPAGPRF